MTTSLKCRCSWVPSCLSRARATVHAVLIRSLTRGHAAIPLRACPRLRAAFPTHTSPRSWCVDDRVISSEQHGPFTRTLCFTFDTLPACFYPAQARLFVLPPVSQSMPSPRPIAANGFSPLTEEQPLQLARFPHPPGAPPLREATVSMEVASTEDLEALPLAVAHPVAEEQLPSSVEPLPIAAAHAKQYNMCD